MSLITVSNLKYSYPQNNQTALDDVSFGIEKGSYVAIVGYNGSGKSTLARLLCGLEVPSAGKIEVQPDYRIGIVFQFPKEQLVSGIVSRDTAFGPQNLGLKASEVELRTIESLNIVDMLDRADSSTSALSLGQTQKIALSGVIALHPEILILDEAVSMLDPESRKEILEFIRYWHRCGNTIIQITHDMEVVAEADTVIGMEKGKIFYYGTKHAFLSSPENLARIEGTPLPITDKSLLKKKLEKTVTLQVRNLNFKYSKDGHGVKDVCFDLYKGTITALTGPSGAGKSTIMELCCGLLQEQNELNSETVVSAVSRPVIAQQNAKAALFEAFAADDVAFGARNAGINGKNLKDIVIKSMNDAALPFDEFGERRTQLLSGGEQRRLSIAGILAMNPDIIFLDEPTAGLDSRARNQVMEMLRNLAEQGKTVLFSTHKRDEADFADREIRIENGRLVSDTLQDDKNDVKSELSTISPVPVIGLLENLRNISLGLSGANRRKKSPVEKLHPALRILVFLAMFIVSLAVRPIWLAAVMFCASAIYGKFCGFSLKNLIKACLKILPFLLFFCIFQLIFHQPVPGEVHYTEWKWFLITPSKLLFCLAGILRTDSALVCLSAFFVSTPEYDLIDGLNVLLFPLKLIKIPVRYLILIIEIIFRFIPVLMDEASSIIKTQAIRGGLGQVKGKMAKIKAIIPLIVPLIIQSVKKSESLADAITMRYFK